MHQCFIIEEASIGGTGPWYEPVQGRSEILGTLQASLQIHGGVLLGMHQHGH